MASLGAECGAAWEEVYACLATADCGAIEPGGACNAEAQAANDACPIGGSGTDGGSDTGEATN